MNDHLIFHAMFLHFELAPILRIIFSNFPATTTVILVNRGTYKQFEILTEEKDDQRFLKGEKNNKKNPVNSYGGLSKKT